MTRYLFTPADRDLIRLAIREDIGRGDITTSFLSSTRRAKAVIKAKENLVVCGTPLIAEIFRAMPHPAHPDITVLVQDGTEVEKGTVIAELVGSATDILIAERTILNFLQRLSGIATNTAQFTNTLPEGTAVRITDTRKTTPGWRTLEKYAVRVGGAYNHRFGLDDGVMIKDNHIVMAGSITAAVNTIRKRAHHLVKIEVECTTLEMVKEALNVGADVIMCDNMSNEEIARAVATVNKQAVVEVSGGINKERIAELATLGIDVISVGKLTHGARAVDINLTLSLL